MMKLIHKNPIPEEGLTQSEQALRSCVIARAKLEIGDYEGGCAVLSGWWSVGKWPNLTGLSLVAAGELLLTAGSLTDAVARTKRVSGGQRLAEALISGAIALFEHLSQTRMALEARLELGCCYYHQGLFSLAHSNLSACLEGLTHEDVELRAVGLIRLAIVQRHSGSLHEALSLLEEASFIHSQTSCWTKGRFRTEMANTLKDIGKANDDKSYL